MRKVKVHNSQILHSDDVFAVIPTKCPWSGNIPPVCCIYSGDADFYKCRYVGYPLDGDGEYGNDTAAFYECNF